MSDEDRRLAAAAWARSAQAYIESQDRGDRNRTELLDPVMLRLCGEVRGLDVLDIGCGEGRFSRMLADHGGRVGGLDLTAAAAMVHARTAAAAAPDTRWPARRCCRSRTLALTSP